MQVKLLRVLEGMEFMRVGGSDTIKVDVRVLAATNSDLEAAVAGGRFRSDLYYRLKVVTIRIPALRERREDIPNLVQHFLERFAAENSRPVPSITSATLRALVNHPWEGNVRELKNLIESLIVLASSSTIDLPDLPPEYQRWLAGPSPVTPDASGAGREWPGAPGPSGDGSGVGAIGGGGGAPRIEGPPEPARGPSVANKTMEEIERDAILETLREVGGNRTKAAERLGIGLRTLQRKLKEYKSRGVA